MKEFIAISREEAMKENTEKSSCYFINGELSISVVNDDKIYLVKYDGNKEQYFELPKTKKLLKFLEIEE